MLSTDSSMLAQPTWEREWGPLCMLTCLDIPRREFLFSRIDVKSSTFNPEVYTRYKRNMYVWKERVCYKNIQFSFFLIFLIFNVIFFILKCYCPNFILIIVFEKKKIACSVFRNPWWIRWSDRCHLWYLQQAQAGIQRGPAGSEDDWWSQHSCSRRQGAPKEAWHLN